VTPPRRRPGGARAALGGVRALPPRRVVVRAVIVLVVLALGLLVRTSGALHGPDPQLPPLDGAARVEPGVLRAGAATETELMLLRDSFDVRGVVAVGDVTVEERAVTRSLGVHLLTIEISDVDAPSPQQVAELLRFVRATAAEGTVFLHDADGSGPVLAVAALVALADRMPLADVLARMTPAERAAISPAQVRVLHEVAAAVAGTGPPIDPYAAALRER
jgi:hypothetical protein